MYISDYIIQTNTGHVFKSYNLNQLRIWIVAVEARLDDLWCVQCICGRFCSLDMFLLRVVTILDGVVAINNLSFFSILISILLLFSSSLLFRNFPLGGSCSVCSLLRCYGHCWTLISSQKLVCGYSSDGTIVNIALCSFMSKCLHN